jgi:L-ascorbate metabolism protein UlaG (beta-lactamase superfamily)
MERIKIEHGIFRFSITIGMTCFILVLFPCHLSSQEQSKQSLGEFKILDNVHWLGQSGIKITNGRIIYVDPLDIQKGETADLILITHDHYDHLSEKDIQLIQGEKTTIIIPEPYKNKVKGNVRGVKPGETLILEGVEIQVVPAYNIGKPYHPREKNYVGYVFTVENVTYYHAGDTDRIPEMQSIQADVVFLPVGGTYTMNPEEAAKAVQDIQPKVAVPIHWGSIIGSREDAERFQSLCDCEVRILETED